MTLRPPVYIRNHSRGNPYTLDNALVDTPPKEPLLICSLCLLEGIIYEAYRANLRRF